MEYAGQKKQDHVNTRGGRGAGVGRQRQRSTTDRQTTGTGGSDRDRDAASEASESRWRRRASGSGHGREPSSFLSILFSPSSSSTTTTPQAPLLVARPSVRRGSPRDRVVVIGARGVILVASPGSGLSDGHSIGRLRGGSRAGCSSQGVHGSLPRRVRLDVLDELRDGRRAGPRQPDGPDRRVPASAGRRDPGRPSPRRPELRQELGAPRRDPVRGSSGVVGARPSPGASSPPPRHARVRDAAGDLLCVRREASGRSARASRDRPARKPTGSAGRASRPLEDGREHPPGGPPGADASKGRRSGQLPDVRCIVVIGRRNIRDGIGRRGETEETEETDETDETETL